MDYPMFEKYRRELIHCNLQKILLTLNLLGNAMNANALSNKASSIQSFAYVNTQTYAWDVQASKTTSA